MTTIDVQDFRGISKAQISCSPFGLVTAENDAGKSSIAQAVAAVLTGQGIDKQFGLNKSTAHLLVHDGAKTAHCVLKGEGGEARMSWPEAKLSTTGPEPPSASIYATGLASIPEIEDARVKANALEAYLKSTPNKDDLTAAMAEASNNRFSTKAVDNLWVEIEARGWDATAAAWETARRDAGRDWGKVTGEQFGSAKAAAWRPAGISEVGGAFTIEEMEANVAEARSSLEAALRTSAIDDAEMSRLKALAEEIGTRNEIFSAATRAVERVREAYQEAIRERHALPAVTVASHADDCPHCGGKVVVRQHGPSERPTVEAYVPIDEEDLKQRRLAIASSDGKIANVTAAVRTAETAALKAEMAFNEAKEAVDKISAGAGSETKPASLANVPEARDKLAGLENDLVMRRKMEEAATLYRQWESANLKLTVLVPEGLRKKKLGEAIEGFNVAILAPLCEVARWGKVTLAADLSVRVGSRPYALLSEGVKWRARIILQVAMAQIDDSDMLIIDNIPDIDRPARRGMWRLLQFAGIPALICMADIEGLPVVDLAKNELGGTWLVEDGKTVPYGVLAAA